MVLALSARILPSPSRASSAVVAWSRPWASARKASLRSPVHLTARWIFARGPQAHDFLGVDEDLGAEAAAHVRGDHAQLVLGSEADEGGQHEAGHVRVLAGGVEGETVVAGVVVADGGARLDGVGDQPVVDEIDLGDVPGVAECGIDGCLVAQVPLVDGVAGRFRVQLRLAGVLGGGDVDGGRQGVVVDGDALGGILGLRQRLADDDGDVVADVAHLALCEGRVCAGLHGRAVLGVDHPAANEPADLVGGDVGACIDRQAARRFHRGGGIDALDVGVGVRRAHEHGVGLAGAIDVVGVLALAGDEALVFLATHWRADAGCAHGCPPAGVPLDLVLSLSKDGIT